MSLRWIGSGRSRVKVCRRRRRRWTSIEKRATSHELRHQLEDPPGLLDLAIGGALDLCMQTVTFAPIGDFLWKIVFGVGEDGPLIPTLDHEPVDEINI